MIMLLLTLENAFYVKAPGIHPDRAADLQSRRATEKARLGMDVRFTIATRNLSMSIWKRPAEIERGS
jgi:hypothetical protein